MKPVHVLLLLALVELSHARTDPHDLLQATSELKRAISDLVLEETPGSGGPHTGKALIRKPATQTGVKTIKELDSGRRFEDEDKHFIKEFCSPEFAAATARAMSTRATAEAWIAAGKIVVDEEIPTPLLNNEPTSSSDHALHPLLRAAVEHNRELMVPWTPAEIESELQITHRYSTGEASNNPCGDLVNGMSDYKSSLRPYNAGRQPVTNSADRRAIGARAASTSTNKKCVDCVKQLAKRIGVKYFMKGFVGDKMQALAEKMKETKKTPSAV